MKDVPMRTMMTRGFRSAFLLSGLLLSTLAHAFTASLPFPLKEEKFTIAVTGDAPSGWNDVPTGAYTIPDTRVVVTKARKISRTEGAFGILGVLAAHSAGSEDGKAVIGEHAQAFRVDLKSEAEQILAAKRNQAALPNWVTEADAAHTLKLTPYIFVTPLEKGTARVYTVVKAALVDANESESWWTRYIAYPAEVRPLTGEASWTEKDGAAFKRAATAGLAEAIDAMLRQLHADTAAAPRKPVMLETMFAGVSELIDVKGELLQEAPEQLIFSPVQGKGSIIYGVHILPRKDVRLH